jgi:hypothetical protein
VLAAKHKYTKFSYLYLLTKTHRQGNLSLKLGKYYLIKQASMEETSSPYKWLGLASLWLLICPIFLILVILGFGSSGAINTFYVLTIGVNLFCSYKFGEEKGLLKGILFFIFAILCDIFFSILIFLILYSLS